MIPYFVSVGVLLIAVFVLFKAVQAYTHPSSDPLQRFVRFEELGIQPGPDLSASQLVRAVLGITGLLAGATLLARFPRLAMGSCLPSNLRRFAKQRLSRVAPKARGPTWVVAGVAAFLIGCLLYLLVPGEVRDEIGGLFYDYGLKGPWVPTLGIMGLALVGGTTGYLVTWRGTPNKDRRDRWLCKGTRPLMVCGALAIGLIVMLQAIPRRPGPPNFPASQVDSFSPELIEAIQDARLTPAELNQVIITRGADWKDTLIKVQPILASQPRIWPVLLAGVAFLYLWWLSILLFDLAFVWHRYVRRSVANLRLQQWNSHGIPARRDDDPLDTHCFCENSAVSR
jgi:hypothetical protein